MLVKRKTNVKESIMAQGVKDSDIAKISVP